MSTHITPPPSADQTGAETAEPARRASRFDERGIALQTVIIMVVLLAIAGTIAAVLLSRAGEVTSELESQDVTATRIDTQADCEAFEMSGGGKTVQGDWTSPKCTWLEAVDNDTSVTAGQCRLAGGKFEQNQTGNRDSCQTG